MPLYTNGLNPLLSSPGWPYPVIFFIISRFEEGVTKHRLEKEAHINGKRLNEILFRLRSNGLIDQQIKGKKHLVFLTEKGKDVIEIIVNLSKLEVKSE